jgi:hypothetical protein
MRIEDLHSTWVVGKEVKRPKPALPPEKPVLVTLKQAEFLYNLGETASENTDDKVKLLLTLTSSTAVLLATLRPEWLYSLHYLPTYALGACLVLATVHFGVRPFFHPAPEPSENEAKSNEEWATCLYDCYVENERYRQIRVNLFAACRRWFLIGILALLLGAIRHPAPTLPSRGTLLGPASAQSASDGGSTSKVSRAPAHIGQSHAVDTTGTTRVRTDSSH